MKCNTTYYPKCTPPKKYVLVLARNFIIPTVLADTSCSSTNALSDTRRWDSKLRKLNAYYTRDS